MLGKVNCALVHMDDLPSAAGRMQECQSTQKRLALGYRTQHNVSACRISRTMLK